MIEIPKSKRGDIAADLMPDFTPLLDVMFMLMVFFMLTANAVPYALDVALPEDVEQVAQAVDNPNRVSVTLLPDDNGWRVNDQHYEDVTAFKEAVLEHTQDSQDIIIIGDKTVSMQNLLDVMVFLRKHNIEAADIVMEAQ